MALAALIIAFLSLVVSAVVASKNYRKSKRDAFIQRRDRLFQTISDLNTKNAEAHLIAARYEIVAVKKAGLPLRGEQAERNMALIPQIKELKEKVERSIKTWDENIEKLHSMFHNLNQEIHAPEIERLISIVQIASDNLKKINDSSLSSLHILETTNEFIKTTLDETEEKLRHIDLDFERGMREFKLTHPD